jgi:hypothetical protein
LKELGVTAVGHRLKLLDVIAVLRAAQSANAPPPPSMSTPAQATLTTATEAAGERRHVTVMFRDLVDSTGIASRLDAEEWRDLVVSTPYFERALQVAHKQHAKSWEPRAAMSMARLWRDQGKRDKARDLLAQVYCWFIEGFDTLDLKELKALLDELNA